MHDSTNPLLEAWSLPPFERIRAEHAVPAIQAALAEARAEIARLGDLEKPAFNDFVIPLERVNERLARIFSPIGHLNAVMASDAWREAHDKSVQLLTAFHTEVAQNRKLFEQFEQLHARDAEVNATERKLIEDNLRDFRLSGVHLPAAQRRRAAEIFERLALLAARFEAHALQAADAWSHTVQDKNELEGLPGDVIEGARARAKDNGVPGWRFALDGPTYNAVMHHAAERSLREIFYRAWNTRASDQGEAATEYDNGPVMAEMLALRHESATLLGYRDYAALSLATKMAPDVDAVLQFLNDLVRAVRPRAKRDLNELKAFAQDTDNVPDFQPWDLNYYAERLKIARFGLGEETLRPYFPVHQVLGGLFEVTRRLFGVCAIANRQVSTWHKDVRYFDLVNDQDTVIAGFYLDPYARRGKRAGAWMDVCTSRAALGAERHLPVAYLTLNAGKPGNGGPALMTFDEVVTLFHEFGHGLNHMLTSITLPSISGIAGVEWDAVELPSQLLENWCWERAALDGFARHHESGAALPAELFERMQEARTFLSGLNLIRQLEFALFDLHLHADFEPAQQAPIQTTLERVRDSVAVLDVPAWNRFAHSFSHIFGGGYAAGYYSYLWAEVLSADAFDVFRDNGIFDADSARRLRDEILARGGSRPAMESFVAFRGREPQIGPLLSQHGIAA